MDLRPIVARWHADRFRERFGRRFAQFDATRIVARLNHVHAGLRSLAKQAGAL